MARANDLEIFIRLFGRDKMKFTKRGVEYRGMTNLDFSVSEAKHLIKGAGLKLTVVNNADMASYGAFEVNNQ